MLEDNLFTVAYKQNSFTNESIDEIVKLHNAIKEKKDKIENWYSKNTTLYIQKQYNNPGHQTKSQHHNWPPAN